MGLSDLSAKYGILLIFISLVFLVIFILLRLKVKYPLINIRILKYKMFTLGLITVCMPMASVLALAFLIPILAQMGLGENALKASFILLPGTLLSGLLAPFMGAKYAKFGVRRLIIPGLYYYEPCNDLSFACRSIIYHDFNRLYMFYDRSNILSGACTD